MWTKILSLIPLKAGNNGKSAGSWITKFFILVIAVILLVWFFPKIKDTIYQLFRKSAPKTENIQDEQKAYGLAYQIAEALGTQREKSWYQITNWTEDEEKVIEILNANESLIPQIEMAYARVSESGDLWGDIQRYFRESQLEQINFLRK